MLRHHAIVLCDCLHLAVVLVLAAVFMVLKARTNQPAQSSS